MLGLVNLVPGSSHDGTVLRLWLTRPADMREGLWAARFREEVSRILRLVDPGDVAPLTGYLDRHHRPSEDHGPDHGSDLLAEIFGPQGMHARAGSSSSPGPPSSSISLAEMRICSGKGLMS